jgi:cysteine desulfurase/selenocysteine lyase
MKSNFDIERARKDTRACENIIHFNNAGSSLMPIPVSNVLHSYLNKEEQAGGYETADEEYQSLENFYQATAKLLNCETGEIAFVENATRAWDMAFYSFKFSKGDKILTTLAEYGSNVIAYNQQVKRFGIEIVFVPNDEQGQIDTHALENLMDDRVKLVSITHIPTGGGLVNPAKEIGKITKSANVPFLLDSCQGVGQVVLDVEDIGCDILCGTGRKYLRGPRGTGLLYVQKRLINSLEPPFLDQRAATLLSPTEYRIRSDAKRFENWEQYFAGKVALGTAIEYASSYGLEQIQSRIYGLAEKFRQKLIDIDGVSVTDEGVEKCGIVTFIAAQMSPPDIKRHLKNNRVNVSISEGAGNLVSFKSRGLTEVVRASVHYYNTVQEIDYFIELLRKILGQKA